MHDLMIIGAGPAGLTAGLYAGRFRLKTLILEKMSVGGQIMFSSTIENYPGFPGGIPTCELIERFKKQIEELGINIEDREVLEIQSDSATYHIKTQDQTFQAKSVIVATGASPKKLGIKGEDGFTGRGVSYCGTCDGPLFKDKEILVVGGGDRAIEEAIFLSGYARKVTVLHRRNELRASKILEERLQHNSKINFILDSVIEEIQGKDKVERISIKNVKTGSLSTLSCQGVFIFVGIQPNTSFLKNVLEMDEVGFIITDGEMLTSRRGIFACGDCRKKNLYQVITACAEGAVAAHSAYKYIANLQENRLRR